MTNVRPAAMSAFAVAVLSAFSALAQLNPTVNVLPRPQAPVPGECEQGLAPAQPRNLVAEAAPQPAPSRTPAAPPTLDLKTRLRAVQTAAEQKDRDAFKSALATGRASIAAYPPGGEREAANDVLRVYDDLERLWDYSFAAPSGSFFDSSTENGALLNMLRRYPDYAKFIGDSTVNIGGNVVYPSSESRTFLVAESSRRLGRLGVRMPERIVETPKPVTPPPPVVAPPSPAPARRASKPAVRKEARTTPAAPHKTTHRTARQPKTKIAEARVNPPKPRTAEPSPQPKSEPVPQPPPRLAQQPAQQPAPVTPTPQPATTMTAMPPAMQTAAFPATTTTAEPTPPTSTTAPAPTSTATSTQPPAQTKGGGRVNLLFAIILIVVGIGVLIVLLRASD